LLHFTFSLKASGNARYSFLTRSYNFIIAILYNQIKFIFLEIHSDWQTGFSHLYKKNSSFFLFVYISILIIFIMLIFQMIFFITVALLSSTFTKMCPKDLDVNICYMKYLLSILTFPVSSNWSMIWCMMHSIAWITILTMAIRLSNIHYYIKGSG
jgi:hypothetical protein